MKNVSLEPLEKARVYLQSNLGFPAPFDLGPSIRVAKVHSLVIPGNDQALHGNVLGRQAQPRNQDPEEGKRFLHEKGNGELYLRKPSGLPLVETT